ncbi:MAG: calcium-binding protein, partial [Actinomycetia bacterium]|nr:calcium-binding protein [Actinomycetes bacterium]
MKIDKTRIPGSTTTELDEESLEKVTGGNQSVAVTGTDDADYLAPDDYGASGVVDAQVDAGAGDDTVVTGGGDDSVDAGAGDDTVDTGEGDDTIDAGAGDDVVQTGYGDDTIDAGAGDDTVEAGEGADTIDGGLGDDTVDGGSGNDTYVYRLGGGNDTFSGGDGNDTISVSNLTSTDGWTVKVDGMDSAISVDEFQDKYDGSLSNLDRQAAGQDDGWGNESDDNDDGYTGVLTAPNGDTVSFDGVDSLDFDVADDPVSGGDYPLVVAPDALPDDATAYTVSGLPAGVTVNGQAEAPQLGDDGTYFQVVDPTALQDGQLSLDFNTGYFGSVDLTVTAYQADSDGNVSEAGSVEQNYSVAPTDDALLFAQAGAISVEDEETTTQAPFTLDTSAVDASAITSNVSLNTNLPAGATILDADGDVIATQGSFEGQNNFSISADKLEGMQVDLSGCSNLDDDPDQEFSINIEGRGFDGDGWNEQDATLTFTAADGLTTNTVQAQGTTPLDIAVNPNLDNAVVNISGIPAGASILDADGNTLYTSTSQNDSGFYLDDAADVAGLQVDASGASDSDFTLRVEVSGTAYTGNFEDNSEGVENVDVTQEVYVNNSTDLSTLDNGDTQMIIHGSQDDYSLARVGNSLVITSNDDPTVVTSVGMADVDYIQFDPPDQQEISVSVGVTQDSMRTSTVTENPSSMVAMSDFVTTLDVSSAVEQLGDDSNALLVVTGLPDGAVVDGAVDLGNGAYGIRPSETDDGSLNIELPVIGDGQAASINVSAYAMTDDQATFLDGAGRVYGYASASADAEAGASVNFGINEHGLTAGASAYADAEAVATAGGSI